MHGRRGEGCRRRRHIVGWPELRRRIYVDHVARPLPVRATPVPRPTRRCPGIGVPHSASFGVPDCPPVGVPRSPPVGVPDRPRGEGREGRSGEDAGVGVPNRGRCGQPRLIRLGGEEERLRLRVTSHSTSGVVSRLVRRRGMVASRSVRGRGVTSRITSRRVRRRGIVTSRSVRRRGVATSRSVRGEVIASRRVRGEGVTSRVVSRRVRRREMVTSRRVRRR